jgi:large subunit ribosomal protein L18
MGQATRVETRQRRKKRVRKKIQGTSELPRLSVYKSRRHIYAQIIDDSASKTLVDASSLAKEIRDRVQNKGGNRDGAMVVGEYIAKRALDKGISKVIFDRNGFLYHGRVKVLADSAREQGLEF